MAGATNRALKAAGVPKASIKTIRVEQGGRLSLRSALVVAHARGLDVGKAHEHLARRDAKEAASPKAVAARKAAMLADRQKRVAGSLGDTAKGMLARRKAAALAARKPPETALDRYTRQVKAMAREKERSDLSDMTASVRDTMAAGRAALASAPKPRGGLERTVVRGFVDRKASVQNVRAIAKSGDFFVHKTGGFSSGYGVTHRPSGTTIYQSHSLGATKAAMDGIAKSGSKILARIEGGDLRAAKALTRYRRGLHSADFYNRAHRKYG